MHWTLALIACLVAWAMIGGIWRASGAVLAMAWGLGQAAYVLTGSSLPLWVYYVTDPIAAFIILRRYGSILDASILALFVPMWWAYFNQTGREQWWTLWEISCLQLLLAGPWPQLQQITFSVSHGPRRAET